MSNYDTWRILGIGLGILCFAFGIICIVFGGYGIAMTVLDALANGIKSPGLYPTVIYFLAILGGCFLLQNGEKVIQKRGSFL